MAVVITLLTLVVSTLCFWYYHEIITWFPSHIHAWTQSDRLALAYGYLENGFDFFTPRTYNLYTEDAITGVDFPIHEYLVAGLMKLFGTKEPFVFRAYTLIYSLIGYTFLYRLARRVTGRDILAAVVVLFAFTSPIITYYQAGFIPSSTSLSSAFIGFYFFFRYKEEKVHAHLYWSIGMLTLAVLPRASVNILLFAVLLMECYEWWKARQLDKRALFGFLIAYSVIAAALLYKSHLGTEYGTRFLTALMPAKDGLQFIDILKESWARWHFQLLTKYHWAILGISVIGLISGFVNGKLRLIDKKMLLMSLLLMGGSVVFFIALARQFIAHEYYFIDSLYPAIILMLIPGLGIVGNGSNINKLIWSVIFTGLLIGATIDSKDVQDEKYAQTEWDRGEVTRKNFTGSDQFLDGLGISRDAKILVFEAYSTNAPLLLMGRRGYTILNSNEENVARALNLDFDYIVVQDIYFASELIYNAPTVAYTLKRIGGNGHISVFKYDKSIVPGIAFPVQRIIPNLLGLENVVYQSSLKMETGIDTLNPATFVDSLSSITKRITNGVEFGGSHSIPLVDLKGANRLLVDISFDGRGADILSDSDIKFDVVLSIESRSDQKQYYKTFRVKRTKSTEVYYGYTCTFDLPEFKENDLIVKCYIWNRFRKEVDADAIRFRAYKIPDLIQ